jgi:flagellar protein FlaG
MEVGFYMVINPIDISIKNLDLQPQVRAPTGKSSSKNGDHGIKANQKPDLSDKGELAADIQKNLNMIHNVDLSFTVHDATGEIMVTVKDETTGEVIREIPPSEVLNLAAKIDAMVGVIFDQKI